MPSGEWTSRVLQDVEAAPGAVGRVDHIPILHEDIADSARPLSRRRLREEGANLLWAERVADVIDPQTRAEPGGRDRVLQLRAPRLGLVLVDVVGTDAAADPVQLLESLGRGEAGDHDWIGLLPHVHHPEPLGPVDPLVPRRLVRHDNPPLSVGPPKGGLFIFGGVICLRIRNKD